MHKVALTICFLLPSLGRSFNGHFFKRRSLPQHRTTESPKHCWTLNPWECKSFESIGESLSLSGTSSTGRSLGSRSLELRAHLGNHQKYEEGYHDYGQMYMELMPNTPQADLPQVPHPIEQTTAIRHVSQATDTPQQSGAFEDQAAKNTQSELYEHSDYYEYMKLRRSEHLRQLQLQIIEPNRKKFAVHVLEPRPGFNPSYAWAERQGLHSTSQWSNALEATSEKGRALDNYLRRPADYGSPYSWKERVGLHSTSLWSNALEATTEYGRELDAFLRQPAPYIPPYSWRERAGLHSTSVWSNALEATSDYGRQLDAFLRQPAEYEPAYSWRKRSGRVSDSVWSNALAATAEQGRQIKALQKAHSNPKLERRALHASPAIPPLPKDAAVIEALKEQIRIMKETGGTSFAEDFARETSLTSTQQSQEPSFRKIEWPKPNIPPRRPQYTRNKMTHRATLPVASDRFRIPVQNEAPVSMIRPPANIPNNPNYAHGQYASHNTRKLQNPKSIPTITVAPQLPPIQHHSNPPRGMRRTPITVRNAPNAPKGQVGGVRSTNMQNNARNMNKIKTLGSHRPTTKISRWAQALDHMDPQVFQNSNHAPPQHHGNNSVETRSQSSLDDIRSRIMGEAKGYIPPPRAE